MARRLFVSIDIDDLDEEVAMVQDPLTGQSGLNPVDPEQAHVTLKFLGDVQGEKMDALVQALGNAIETVDIGPFVAEFGGLGVFPSLDYISVIWLGVRNGGPEMTRLYETIEDCTTSIGFDPEDHEFTPHVTLARMEHAASKDLVRGYVTGEDPDAGQLRVTDVRLKESTLGPDGPEYHTLHQFPL